MSWPRRKLAQFLIWAGLALLGDCEIRRKLQRAWDVLLAEAEAA